MVIQINRIDAHVETLVAELRNMLYVPTNFIWNAEKFNRCAMNNYWGSEWPFNVGVNGKEICKLMLKENQSTDRRDPTYDIKVGNYYLQFMYHARGGSHNVGVVDLKWNKDNVITRKGIHPDFAPELGFDRIKRREVDYFNFYTFSWVFKTVIIDRLKQMLSKKTAKPNIYLLKESINQCFNFSQQFEGFTDNYKLKMRNKVVFIPYNPGNKVNGSWMFHSDNNPRGTFSDFFNSDIRPDLDKVGELCNACSLILGENSEEGSSKGNFVIFNKHLQKLRGNNDAITYEDVMYGVVNGTEDLVYTIYEDPYKFFARIRSFITSDSAEIYDFNKTKVNEGNDTILFNRSQIYLAHNKNEYGFTPRSKTTLNALAVYVPIDEEAVNLVKTVEDFNKINKNEYSRRLHGADCHIAISPELGDMQVRLRRCIREYIGSEHLSPEFREYLKVREQGSTEFNANVPYAYEKSCSKCKGIMTPIKIRKIGEDELEYTPVDAEKDHYQWYCPVCNDHEIEVGKALYFNAKYPNVEKIDIREVEIADNNEIGINIYVDIIVKAASSRMVSSIGLKGHSVVMSQNYVGYISGVFKNIEGSNEETLIGIPVDMVVPFGAEKAGKSGISLSYLRFQNALFRTKICPDEELKQKGNLDSLNLKLKDIQQCDYSYCVWDETEKKFNFKTVKAYVGIEDIKITEDNEEFTKVYNENNPIKVSIMNRISYQKLGFEALDNALIQDSLTGTHSDNYQIMSNFLKCYYDDIKGLNELIRNPDKTGDFNITDKRGRVQLNAEIDIQAWQDILTFHPFFTSEKLIDGGYYRYTPTAEQLKEKRTASPQLIVFPARNILLSTVKVINGNKVQLGSLVNLILEIFLDIREKGFTNKLKTYHDLLFKRCSGKKGLFSQMSTYFNLGFASKEVGCGYLPTGVAVIGSKKFWKMVAYECKKEGKDFMSYYLGKTKLYGSSQRDPNIWTFQGMNIVELWSIPVANRYFKKHYGIQFSSTNMNHYESEMYPNFKTIMLNPLDMIYLYQTDADGDLRRILFTLDSQVQNEMKIVHLEYLKDYKIICEADETSPSYNIIKDIEKWQLDYLMGEAAGGSVKFQKKFDAKGSGLNISYLQVYAKDRNSYVLKGVQKKRNIGTITTTMWTIQVLTSYLYSLGDKSPVILSKLELDGINNLIQTALAQDGCIRSLKGNLDLSRCTIDELSANGTYIGETFGQEIVIRKEFQEEAKARGYEWVIPVFYKVLDWWKVKAAIKLRKTGTAYSDIDAMSDEAIMVLTLQAMMYGNKFINLDKRRILGVLVKYILPHMLEYKIVRPIINELKKYYKE